MEMHDSDMQLPIAADDANHPPPQDDIVLTLKMPAPFNNFILDVDVNDTIQQLKEKVQEIAIGRLVIKSEEGVELSDQMTLTQCQIWKKSDVTVEFQPTLTPQAAANKMNVVLQYGEGRMPVEVRAAHKVSQLRTKLELRNMNFEIPEAYFFVHNHDLMDEELSFTLQNVAQGDVIEIFEGRLSKNVSLQLKTGRSETIIVKTAYSDDTIKQLKEKIQIIEGIPIARMLIKNEDGMDLPDDKTLQDCAISSDSGIRVEFLAAEITRWWLSLPAPPSPLPAPHRNHMGVVLQYKGGRRVLYVRVMSKVKLLRMSSLANIIQFPEPYFFTHKQAVMNEEISFASHNVAHGDVIQIFLGRVERGGGS